MLRERIVIKSINKTASQNQLGTGDSETFNTKVIGLKFSILDKKININIEINQAWSRLSDIVPAARRICQKITYVVLEKALNNLIENKS